jgi:hypothetical protein
MKWKGREGGFLIIPVLVKFDDVATLVKPFGKKYGI